ncbi:MAG: hypothetical protein ABII80_02350 [bacterium]
MADFNIGEKLKFQGTGAATEYPSFNTLFNNILPNVYLAAGLVIFVMIVIGGFTILANSGNQEKTAEGAKTITSAIIGLLVLFASYWIIQIVQVVTGIQILNSTL